MDARQSSDRQRVLDILRNVRTRWRLHVAMRGAAIVLAAGMAAFLISAYGLNVLRFSASAVIVFRLLAWGAVAALAYLHLVRPLRAPISEERVALYLEEHEPSLEAHLLAAVEAERDGDRYPPDLVRGIVHAAVERARAVDDGRRVDQQRLYRSGGVLAAVAVASTVFLLFLPTGVRHGLSALLRPTAGVADVNPYSITVTPGDVIVARGSDQLIVAELAGFNAANATLFTRQRKGESFQRLTMFSGATAGSFELMLLNLTDGADYFVEADGTRSPVFRLDVADLPYVDRLEQALRFPAYTGLADRVIEDGGDVAAIIGTVVTLRIHPTIPSATGMLVVEGRPAVALTPVGDSMLAAAFTVAADGFYRIELAAPDGRLVEASPRYTIDALEDQPPQVRVTKPGRDGNTSPIEEVYFEAEALDDYGVAELNFVYSVNGGDPRTVRVFEGASPPLKEASAGHTVYLEEMDLEAGDLVTYWATARDHGRTSDGGAVTSDLYFLTIRALGSEYRQADAPPGGGAGGMGQQGPESSLSELQKQVIAATFNLDRDRARHSAQDFSENVVSVRLAQEQVRAQVETLVQRMVNRGLSAADEQFRNIAEMLPIAVQEMEAAEAALVKEDVKGALPHEQKALQHVQRAEETYEKYVTLQQQGGGGGGGGANAADLADLFELELDKLRNQYETVQRGAREEQANQVDGLLEKLRELARRQRQAAERRRLEAQGGSRNADEQRALADQTEEMARQLERLSRETRDQQLAETVRNLQNVANQMRQAAAQGGSAGAAGASAAADRLAEEQRRLERERQRRLGEDVEDAARRAERLTEEEAQIRQQVRALVGQTGADLAQRIRQLHERKDRMFGEVEDLREQLQRMSAEASREDDRDAAQTLAEAADEIEERKIREKIAYSKGVVDQRSQDPYASTFEAQIAMDLDELLGQVYEARDALDEASPQPMEEALGRARSLMRGTETLGRRLQQGRQEEQGQDQQGERGQAWDQQSRSEQEDQSEEQSQGQQGGQQGQPGGQGQDRSDSRLDPRAQGQVPLPGGGGWANEPGAFGPDGGATRGGARTRPLTAEEIREFRREFQARLSDAQALRMDLARAGADAEELANVLDALEQLSGARPYADLPELERLQSTLRDNLQRLEFRIRREVEGDGSDKAVLSGPDEVPDKFRALVEEYFRALSRSGGAR